MPRAHVFVSGGAIAPAQACALARVSRKHLQDGAISEEGSDRGGGSEGSGPRSGCKLA